MHVLMSMCVIGIVYVTMYDQVYVYVRSVYVNVLMSMYMIGLVYVYM